MYNLIELKERLNGLAQLERQLLVVEQKLIEASIAVTSSEEYNILTSRLVVTSRQLAKDVPIFTLGAVQVVEVEGQLVNQFEAVE